MNKYGFEIRGIHHLPLPAVFCGPVHTYLQPVCQLQVCLRLPVCGLCMPLCVHGAAQQSSVLPSSTCDGEGSMPYLPITAPIVFISRPTTKSSFFPGIPAWTLQVYCTCLIVFFFDLRFGTVCDSGQPL